MKLIIALFFIMVSTTAIAESTSLNLSIPSLPQNFSQDRFRAGDLDCANAIGSATNLEIGVTGVLNQEDDPLHPRFDERRIDTGIYARIVIPLGARPKTRVNCDTLYQLELEKKRLEVLKLRRELDELKALQFQN